MTTKQTLKLWIVEALRQGGGTLHHIQVAKEVWANHEGDLRDSGDLFFTWQYDIRWAALVLRQEGVLKNVEGARGDGCWSLR